MILDSSALVAIALGEPERDALLDRIDAAETVAVGAPTLVEAGIVLTSRTGEQANGLLHRVLTEADATVLEFGDAHRQEAVSAWQRFGRGRHPAGLNFGDCFAYATAKVAGQPLLAKGDDFAQTDIELA